MGSTRLIIDLLNVNSSLSKVTKFESLIKVIVSVVRAVTLWIFTIRNVLK